MRRVSIIGVLVMLVACSWAQQPSSSTPPDKTQPSAASKAPEKPPTKRVVADLSGFELDPNKSKAQGLQIGAGSRGAAVPPALYAPSLGKAYGLRPVFYWGDTPGAQKFTFRIYDADDDEIYEQDVPASLHTFTYPADAPALKVGATYSWTVQAAGGQLIEPPEPVRIMLLSGADRQTVEQALQSSKGDAMTDRQKRAQVFVDHRLWYDAIGAYSQLISENHSNADLYRERAQIYAQLPATQALANQDMEQASKLQGGNH